MKLLLPSRLILCLSVVAFLSACNRAPKTEGNEANKADTTKSVTKDSFAKLNDEIAANPRSAELLYERAKIFEDRNVMNSAFSDASAAVAIDSTETKYLMLLADIAFKTYQIKKASETFEKVTKLEPKNPEAFLKLAELYFYIKGYQKSVYYANEALKLDKHLVRAYYIKGFVYKEKGDTALAVSSFNTVLDIQPEDYDACIQLGNIYSVRKSVLALQYYNNALKYRPGSTEAFYNRGLFYQMTGQFDKAMFDYETILKLDPKYADAYYNIGFINSVEKKDYKTAIVNFTDAIRCDEQYAEAFYNRNVL